MAQPGNVNWKADLFDCPLARHSPDPGRNDEQLHSDLRIHRQTTLPLEFIYPRFSKSSTSKALTKVANSLENGAKMSHRAAKQAKKLKSNTQLSQFGAKPAKMAKNAHKSLNRTGNVLYKTAQVFRAMANLFQKGGGKNAGVKRRDQ